MATTKKAAVKKSPAKKAVAQPPAHQGLDWRSLYLYAVSLITLMICLFAAVSVINGVLNILMPDPGWMDAANYPDKTAAAVETMRQQTLDDNQRRAIKSLLTSVSLIVVAFPLYRYHWKQTRKSD